MKSTTVLLALGILLASAGATGPALAQDKDKVIADRQNLMKRQVREWIVVRNYLQGNADQQAATAAVDNLAKSLRDVPNYFPSGTAGPTPDGKYATKPEVWTQHDKFLAADKKVADQVAALGAAVKSGDKAKAEVAFKELDGCDACHKDFRAKLQ
jgi:cytochrome c556